MQPSHKKQTDDGIIRSLNKAGIRHRYHRTMLADSQHKDAARILEWVNGASKEDMSKGWTFIGGNDVEDLAIITARGLHLTGRPCFVMTLLRFCSYMNEDASYLEERLGEVSTLLITHATPVKENDDVFTRRELRQLQERMNEWMDDGNRLLIHGKLQLNSGWYSAEFLQRVAQVNENLGVWK
jgi:hypothetical protein